MWGGVFDFLFKYKHWLVFILLEAVSLIGLFSTNGYQKSVYFTTANSIVGYAYSTISSITSYLNLVSVNRDLEAENEKLRIENVTLKTRLQLVNVDTLAMGVQSEDYNVVVAQVINFTLHKRANLMTINKGSADGIKPEMGVVCSQGVVGVVYLTSEHYAIVMPLLNVNCRISCYLNKSEYFGTLEWERGDSRSTYATGFPRHTKIQEGELIETNGYSDIFPPGIPIGKVSSIGDSEDGMSYRLKVSLFTNFEKLRDVSVITNYIHRERRELEQSVENKEEI